jgi:hypothetical protein
LMWLATRNSCRPRPGSRQMGSCSATRWRNNPCPSRARVLHVGEQGGRVFPFLRQHHQVHLHALIAAPRAGADRWRKGLGACLHPDAARPLLVRDGTGVGTSRGRNTGKSGRHVSS